MTAIVLVCIMLGAAIGYLISSFVHERDWANGYLAGRQDERIIMAEGPGNPERLAWERDVLQDFVGRVPGTGEAPDYINALSRAMLDSRGTMADLPELPETWLRDLDGDVPRGE